MLNVSWNSSRANLLTVTRNVDTQMQCCIKKYGFFFLYLSCTLFVYDLMSFIQIRLGHGEALGFGLGLDN